MVIATYKKYGIKLTHVWFAKEYEEICRGGTWAMFCLFMVINSIL